MMATKAKKVGFYLEELPHSKERINNEEKFNQLLDADEYESQEIIQEILVGNLGLIRYVLNKRYGSGLYDLCTKIRVTPDDFFSTGYYALMKAIYTFDISKGYKFATYASMCLHNEYGMFIRSHKRSFAVSSMNEVTYKGDRGEDSDITLLEMLSYDDEALEEVILEDFGFLVMDELNKVIKPRDMAILRMYISGGDDGMTQKEISEQLGISQSYVARLIAKTMNKARNIYKRLEQAG